MTAAQHTSLWRHAGFRRLWIGQSISELGSAVSAIAIPLVAVLVLHVRQAITPDRMLGRMNATMRFFVWGTIPLGAFLGGVLGSWIGLRPAIAVFAGACLLTPLPVLMSPLPRLRDVSELMPPSDADLSPQTAR